MIQALEAFIEAHTRQVEPLVIAQSEAYWRFTTTGRKEDEEEYARLTAALRKVYADRQAFARLRQLMEAVGLLKDGAFSPNPEVPPLLARQARILYDDFRGLQIDPSLIDAITDLEKEIESTFNTFRATLRGKPVTDNQIRQILRASTDPALRQEAWEASKQIGAQVAERLLRLVDLRNQGARQVGFDNFYTMSLALAEQDEGELFRLLSQLDQLTRPLFAAYKAELDAELAHRFGIDPHELRPWHYSDPFFQEPPETGDHLSRLFEGWDPIALSRAFYTAIGLDIEDILARSDLYEREGKQQHAYCIHIDRKGDVRILANLQPDAYWTETMLHELGHAVYDQHIDRNLPFLLRTPAHILSTEAIAVLMGRLIYYPAWLRRYLGLEEEILQGVLPQALQRNRAKLLIFTRWVLVMAHFERALYQNPRQDLNRLWWDLVEEFQMVRRPPGRDAPDWAAKIHLSTAPVYYHNYLLGELAASQLLMTLRARIGEDETWIASPETGAFLIQRYFRPGRSVDWNTLLVFATGYPLSPEPFARDLHA
ncbi:M2 family metallopeptidase [Thermoflexus sp.]|uniref:M2 family metallopeptidase n=1 Tax=Thermoflexus sp. TaxID=1969742 RepID=UPI0025F0BE12|nr:M2 family metallopeptidase [Thermoflexus sp.]MDW8180899.1 M2 family metallopeptidase [Anaerolineae bacterium]MCS6964926.1 M2 family metallopeptidase [Thermoflexus sp.]MCS7351442.1 M2 family metallopeptidase [Thermoflexus sp.]MCX7690007.1 M2 family metallopeptidase [Thermoflexus sp.]MDW8185747.1 M2 family metallopeptidase [Anaerolineae bacterium]